MSYTQSTEPKNFAEYIECCMDELIVRRLLPRKELGIETSGLYKTNKTVYQAFCNDCGYQIDELDKPNHPHTQEKKYAYEDPTPRYIGNGKSICDIYEWINIVIHKPEKFIKVTIAAE
ncbi:MAG: hypothetical protein WC929_00175 [Bacilli bacterium]|jgi:hypothetical protein